MAIGAKSSSELYEFMEHMYVRVGAKDIVLLTEDPEKALGYCPPNVKIYVAYSRYHLIVNRRAFLDLPQKHGVKLVAVSRLDKEFLNDKLVFCTDYAKKRRTLPRFALGYSRFALANALFSITYTDGKGRRQARRIAQFLKDNKTALIGRMSPQASSEWIGLSGKVMDVYGGRYPLLPTLAIVAQFNEKDIIEATIKHLLSQGVDVHIIDNWSTDGSYEAVVALAKQQPDRISVERFPAKATNKYEWEKILNRITDVAKKKSQYKWIIFNDADEIRWSPWKNVTLQRALSFIDHVGYNCVDYTVFNFAPVQDGFDKSNDPNTFFDYGEFALNEWNVLQLKTWKNHPKAEIASSGGHIVNFPGRKSFPVKFLLGHYPLRSNTQARRKIFKDRQPRFDKAERKKGWHVHYDGVEEKRSFIRSKEGLVNFHSKDFAADYLMPRLFGTGLMARGDKRSR